LRIAIVQEEAGRGTASENREVRSKKLEHSPSIHLEPSKGRAAEKQEAKSMARTDEEVQALLEAMNKPEYPWRTIPGLCRDTGLNREEVLEVISSHPEVVQSTRSSTLGEPLYTTRDHFERSSSATDRLLGALRNRLD
jgi:hypothetical protein